MEINMKKRERAAALGASGLVFIIFSFLWLPNIVLFALIALPGVVLFVGGLYSIRKSHRLDVIKQRNR